MQRVGRGRARGDRRRRRAAHRRAPRQPRADGRRAGRGGRRPITRGRPEGITARGHPPRAADPARARLGLAGRARARAGARSGRTSAPSAIVGEMGSTQAIKQAVRAGVGVSLISRRAVEDECRAGLLACVPVSDLTSRAPSTWSPTATAAGRRWPRRSSPSSNPSSGPTDPRNRTCRHGRDARPHSSDFLRRLRRLSVQDGSWRSPGGAGRAQAGRSAGGRGAQSARRSRARRRRSRLSPRPRPGDRRDRRFLSPVVDDPGPGARSPPSTPCPTSTPWAARCCSRSPWRVSRATWPRRSSPRSSAAGAEKVGGGGGRHRGRPYRRRRRAEVRSLRHRARRSRPRPHQGRLPARRPRVPVQAAGHRRDHHRGEERQGAGGRARGRRGQHAEAQSRGLAGRASNSAPPAPPTSRASDCSATPPR